MTVLEETRGLDLLCDGWSRLGGCVLLDNRKGRFIVAMRQGDVLATGGGATMYQISLAIIGKSRRWPGDGVSRRS